ncbi:hypothetical protein A5819_001543 [Enterococcus sp. 7E2_DIV0204]|nr:hypothetical protein A5819_001543 [Enterococcus sp. 7E2_DIV0204]OTP51506.1 hypothetical protein A5884_000701 [Enterococcus sp. 7D2_DIV0200]
MFGGVLFAFIIANKDVYAQSDLDIVYDDGAIEEFFSQEKGVDISINAVDRNSVPEQGLIPDIPADAKPISDRENFESEVSTESTIGSDDRKIVFDTTINPYKKVVFLVMTFPNGVSYIGSGDLVSSDTVLTAGHCIYSKEDGGFATTVAVYPGYNGNYAPYGVGYAKKLMTVSGWSDKKSSEHDIGAIKLDRNLGDSVG